MRWSTRDQFTSLWLIMHGAFSTRRSINSNLLAIGQIISALLLYVGSQYGIFPLYFVAGIMLSTLLIIAVGYCSRNSLSFFAVVFSFFVFRYLPILKFSQPLFDDPWSDLRTATFFADAGRFFEIPQMPNHALTEYSRWPPLHLLSITISRVLGTTLFDVFTYFGPLLAFPSLLFIYLLARQLFSDAKKAALSALVISVFAITVFWQIQVVRQNLAISMFCGGIYAYVKSRQSKTLSPLLASLLFFSILPFVHHLTSLAALATLIFAFIVERAYWRDKVSSAFVLYVASITVWVWVAFQGDFIISPLFYRALALIYGPRGGDLQFIQSRMLLHFDLYDLLNILRILCLALVAVLGLFHIVKRKPRFGGIVAALFVTNAVPLCLALFYRVIDQRFALLLTLPTAVLAGYMRPGRRLVLALLLVLLVIPAPFKLYETFDAAPTYVFDSSAGINYGYGEFSKYRTDGAIALAQWSGKNNNMPVATDGYDIQVLQQYYNPALIYYLELYRIEDGTVIIFNRYYVAGRYGDEFLTGLRPIISRAAFVYNDGTQVVYYVVPEVSTP